MIARLAGLLAMALLAACHAPTGAWHAAAPEPVSRLHPRAAAQTGSPPLVAAARAQVGVTLAYDPAYVVLDYPGGDVPADRGVCTDVVVRALRTQGIDLQASVHQDMQRRFGEYPQTWGLKAPDRNIDHRRVPNQMEWFDHQGWSRPRTLAAADYAAGDIVAWKLTGSGLLHVGIVSDRKARDGTPLVIHNIGSGTREEDLLFKHAIIGHYRPVLPSSPSPR